MSGGSNHSAVIFSLFDGKLGIPPLAWQVLIHGSFWTLGLGAINLAMMKYADRHPTSWLARSVSGGFFNTPGHIYVVAMIGQAVMMPASVLAAWSSRDRSALWWFVSQQQPASGAFLAYVFGYMLSSTVVHWEFNSFLVKIHHLAALGAACCASVSPCWLGLFMVMSEVYELGSWALEFGDIRPDLLKRSKANNIFGITNVAGLAILIHGLVVSWPQGNSAWFPVTAALVAGVLRAREWHANKQPGGPGALKHE